MNTITKRTLVVDNNTFNLQLHFSDFEQPVDIQLNLMKFQYETKIFYSINYELYFDTEDLISNWYLSFITYEDLPEMINHINTFLIWTYSDTYENVEQLFQDAEYQNLLTTFIQKNKY